MVGTFKECGDSVYIADQSVSRLLSIKHVHQMSSLLQNASDTLLPSPMLHIIEQSKCTKQKRTFVDKFDF